MKASKKRGFTIIELVIVIAVIAILAAVLIPTFSNVIQKAKEASDTSMVRNLNSALKMDATNEHKTMKQALAAVADGGFDLTKIKATASDSKILWDSKNDCFVYLKKDATEPSYIPDTKKESAEVADYWEIVETVNSTSNYSQYLNNNTVTSVAVSSGFDAGKNTRLTSVVYSNTSNNVKSVIINTNSGETDIEINAAADTVKHYGTAKNVTINAVGDKSYHEFGSVYKLVAKTGRIVLESTSLVFDLQKATDADEKLKFESNGTVVKTEVESVAKSTSYNIENLEQLAAFRDYVNAGMNFSDLPVEIKADIDMSSVSWNPIGTAQHPFSGTINGNGHTLKGLTNGNIAITDETFVTETGKVYGSAYGFIGIAGAKEEGKTLTVSNIYFADVDIDMTSNGVGALLGYAPSTEDFSKGKFKNGDVAVGTENKYVDINIDKITVSGKIEALDAIGGVCGRLYTDGNISVTNCVNKADLAAKFERTAIKVSGIIGYTSPKANKNLIVSNNINEGSVYGLYASGIVNFNSEHNASIKITNNENRGTIKGFDVTKLFEDKSYYNCFVAYVAGDMYSESTGTIGTYTGNKNSGTAVVADGVQKGIVLVGSQGNNNGKEFNK